MNTAILIGGIVAASVVFTVVLVVAIVLILKSNSAYEIGVARAVGNASITELLGSPVKAAFFMSGGIRGGNFTARVKLKGSRGAGKLFIQALLDGNDCRFQKLEFYSGEQMVNLLGSGKIENRRLSETIFLSAAPNK